MAKNCEHKNPLQRDGSSQDQRHRYDLNPQAIELDNRSTEDLLLFAYRYAAQLTFFDLDGTSDKNWQVFFEQVSEQSLEEIEAQSNNEPHFALFLCFLKLFKHAQGQLNHLTKRHLDFYYQQVLQIKKKEHQADQVHLICTLAKNTDQTLLKEGLEFNGGKDAAGKLRTYQLPQDNLINRAEVRQLHSVFKKNKKLFFATQSNSEDGMGEAFTAEHTPWAAFGSTDLPRAALGFALASPALLLREGQRKIRFIINLTSSHNFATSINSGVLNNIKLYASGEKDWIGPFVASNQSKFSFGSGRSHPQLMLEFDISQDEEAIIAYNPENLGGNFDTLSPLARIIFEPMEEDDTFFHLQTAALRSIRIEVEVNGMKEMQLENDLGALDGSKSFMPFGPRPVRGSNFFIGSQEAFTKKLKNFRLNFQWQNKENDLANHYEAYNNNKLNEANFTAELFVLDKKNWSRSKSYPLFEKNKSNKTLLRNFTDASDASGQRLSEKSKGTHRVKEHRAIEKNGFHPFFEKAAAPNRQQKERNKGRDIIDSIRRNKPQGRLSTTQKDGFIKLSLLQDFGHQSYPTVYTLAIAKNTDNKTNNDVSIPKEPYTPLVESISLDYSATTEQISFQSSKNKAADFQQREIQFFHITPFGQSERHPYLNSQLPFNHSSGINLLPDFQNEGEFFIGLDHADPGDQISLLFQLAEGSANPDKNPAVVNVHCLVQNQWMSLMDGYILADHTNGLLTSGIVKINLPKEADIQNTLLETGLIWLRLSMKKDTDSVAKFIGLHAQAFKVSFSPNENSLEHLASALPAKTISKMINRLPQIKKVEQPYASFNGVPAETDEAYYTRVSERLRHKNRAISIWDYEHLVLQHFPSVYKVKCLNHSSLTTEIAPGYITMIVIPNLQNQNAADPLKPKVDSNTLANIEAFLSQRASRFAKIQARNPDYEEIQLELKVTFRQQFEEGFYKKVLNTDLINFFTPWANEAQADIRFGGSIHKSTIINFLEALEYIDHVDALKMFHINKDNTRTLIKKAVKASSSRAILVSAKEHTINPG